MTLPVFLLGTATCVTFFAGFALGLGYFAVLRRTVDLYVAGSDRLVPAILTLGRLAAAILFLVIAARSGAQPLVASFMGFLLARGLALRTLRRAT